MQSASTVMNTAHSYRAWQGSLIISWKDQIRLARILSVNLMIEYLAVGMKNKQLGFWGEKSCQEKSQRNTSIAVLLIIKAKLIKN